MQTNVAVVAFLQTRGREGGHPNSFGSKNLQRKTFYNWFSVRLQSQSRTTEEEDDPHKGKLAIASRVCVCPLWPLQPLRLGEKGEKSRLVVAAAAAASSCNLDSHRD